MSIELTMLMYSVALTFIIIAIPASMQIMANGVEKMAGNRDDLPEPSVMVKRARRLQANMIENMALFAPLVLIAHAAGVSTEMTVLGAQLFFFARVAHTIIYLAGWPWIRPLAWFAGVIGIVLIFLALL